MLKPSLAAALLLSLASAAIAAPPKVDSDDGGIKLPEGFRALVVAAAPAVRADKGLVLYQQACAPCHMADGKGVPGMQPAVAGSPRLSGDAKTLIDLMLLGPQRALPSNREAYTNVMPAFDSLADDDIAGVLSYVRRTFANVTAPIAAAEVAARRRAAAAAPSAGSK